MPQIPLYNESASRTTSSPVREISAEPQAAVGRSLSGIGGLIYDMGVDYEEKKRDLKLKADVSDYEVELRRFGTDLAQKKTDAANSGVGYADMYDKVVAPEMAKFQEQLGQRGYSKDSINGIMQRWSFDSAGIRDSEIQERESMELLDYAERIKNDAFGLINDGNVDGGFELLDSIKGIVGETKVNQWKSKGVYTRNINNLMTLNNIDEIKEFIDSDQPKEMDPAQYQQFRNIGDSHIRKITANVIAPQMTELNKRLKNATLTYDNIDSSNIPENQKRLLRHQLNNNIEEWQNVNPKVSDEIWTAVDDFLSGSYSGKSDEAYDKLLKMIEDNEVPSSVAVDYLEPIIEHQKNQDLNAPFFMPKEGATIYERNVSRVMGKYREAFDAANAGLSADERMIGFGSGYKKVLKFVEQNKGAYESGTNVDDEDEDSIIRQAVLPAVQKRIQRQSKERAINMYQAPKPLSDDQISERLDNFWNEEPKNEKRNVFMQHGYRKG